MTRMRQSIRSLMLVVGLAGFVGVVPDAQAAVRYVDASATGANNGNSWANAYTSIHSVFNGAALVVGDEIWIANGTYKPSSTSGYYQYNKNNIGIYGGFAGGNSTVHPGGETQRDQRNSDPATNGCVLSGDLGVAGDMSDNCYFLFGLNQMNNTFVLDGFTITQFQRGLTLYDSTSPTINNCIFDSNGKSNYSSSRGGIECQRGCSPKLNNCKFINNYSATGGGGMGHSSNSAGAPTLVNCLFKNNQAVDLGGGLYCNGSPTLIGCVFVDNEIVNGGGGMSGGGTLIGCKFLGNSQTNPNGGGAEYGGGGVHNYTGHLRMINCVFVGNTAAYGGGGLYMKSYSGTSNQIINCTFTLNTTPKGSGAGIYIEQNTSSTTVSNSILYNNSANGSTSAYAQFDCRTDPWPTMNYCCMNGSLWWGQTGNLNANPQCTDADGSDNLAGTEDDDVSLLLASPCIDRGNNATVLADAKDIDGDGNTTELTPYDIVYHPRFFDELTKADGGSGTAPIVDIGAYEYASSQVNVNQHPSSITRRAGQTATFTVSATGLGTLGYQWQINTGSGWANVSGGTGATSDTYTTAALSLASSGYQYRCVVSDLFGSGNSNAATLTVIEGSVLYVKAGASGANTGVGWTDAFSELRNALACTQAGESWEIWVAAGTYKPTTAGGSRTASLVLRSGVAVYGGFIGTETLRDQRNNDPFTNGTILSGDIDASYSDSYHLLTATNADASAILDGFTLTGARADGGSEESKGGGLYLGVGSPTVRHCRFTNLYAANQGGAIYKSGSGPLTLEQCTFDDNLGYQQGGALFVNSGTVAANLCRFLGNDTGSSYGGAAYLSNGTGSRFTNCLFSGNRAQQSGGAIYTGSGLTVTGCTFSLNSGWAAEAVGGGIYVAGSSINLTNSILWGNTAATGPQIAYSSGTPSATRSCVQGGITGTGNLSSNPLFADADGADNIVGTLDDNLALQAGSPCIGTGSTSAAVLVSSTTSAAGTPTTVVLSGTTGYAIGDEIEYDNDHTLRTLTAVDAGTGTLTFDEPLAVASASGKSVKNYGAGDLAGQDRVINCTVDIGAYESTSFSDCDNNGIADGCDVADPENDCNGNSIPDACEDDGDNDTVIDACDNCVATANSDQANADGDAYGDACDGCPSDVGKSAPGICGCGIPDSARTQITGQPSPSSQCAGATVQFTVTATGQSLTYQWHKGVNPVTNGGHYSGATTATLTVTNTDPNDAGNYSCQVTGDCQSATSNSAALAVITQPIIIQQPGTATPYPGQNATFSVAATGGEPFTYQWRRGTSNLSNSSKYSGVTTSSLTISNAQVSDEGSDYNCVINGACGTNTTSNATLALLYITQITGQPANAYACAGGTSQFTVSAAGTGTLTYQWRRGTTALSNNSYYSGVTGATLTVSNVDASVVGTNYNCVVTGAGGNATSANAALDFNISPVIGGADTRSLVVAENSTCGVQFNQFVLTASDRENDTLQWSIDTPADFGTASFVGASTGNTVTVCYAPDNGSQQADSFVVACTDPCGHVDTVTVNAEIAGLPAVLGWEAVSNHTSFGDVSIPLDPAKTGSDTGANGPTVVSSYYGIQKIIVTFDQPMQAIDGASSSNDVQVLDEGLVNHPPSIASLNGGNWGTTLTLIFLDGLPDGQRYTIDVAGGYRSALTSYPVDTGTSCQVRAVAGDVGGDGSVGLGDVAAVKSHNRAALSEATVKYDLNLDGKINLIDAAMARSRYGSNVP